MVRTASALFLMEESSVTADSRSRLATVFLNLVLIVWIHGPENTHCLPLFSWGTFCCVG
jgi:hypothetical protein